MAIPFNLFNLNRNLVTKVERYSLCVLNFPKGRGYMGGGLDL